MFSFSLFFSLFSSFLPSSDSRDKKTKNVDTIVSDQKDQQIRELLEKIKFLEFDLTNAYASKRKTGFWVGCDNPIDLISSPSFPEQDKDEAEKDALLLQTKLAIDIERNQIATENLKRERNEAVEELTTLKEKFKKDSERYQEVSDGKEKRKEKKRKKEKSSRQIYV